MPKKTISVRAVVEMTNKFLADSVDECRLQRAGMSFLCERILFDTGNYKGYGYLDSETVGADEPHAPGTTYLRVGYDDTRRFYYYSGK